MDLPDKHEFSSFIINVGRQILWLRFGITAHPSLNMCFIPLIGVKHCGARGFRTYSNSFYRY